MNSGSELVHGKLLLTVNEAAAYLGIGRSHLYAVVMRNEIRSVLIGRSRRIPAYALREFVARLEAEDDGR